MWKKQEDPHCICLHFDKINDFLFIDAYTVYTPRTHTHTALDEFLGFDSKNRIKNFIEIDSLTAESSLAVLREAGVCL